MNESISELDWERFVLGELPEKRSRILRELLLGDPQLQQKVENLKRSNREELARYPAGSVVPGIRERSLREHPRATPERTSRRTPLLKRFLVLSPALAAALILIFVVLPTRKTGLAPGPGGSFPDSQTIKGTGGPDLSQTRLLVFRQRSREVEQMSSGQTARAGDLMQLAFVSTERHGVILSIDGRGTVSLHFPERAADATGLEPNKRITLPQAIELDDAPSFERFFFVTSAGPIDVRAVLLSAADLARDPRRAEGVDLSLPSGLGQTSFLVRK
jgi:hypothetical protein